MKIALIGLPQSGKTTAFLALAGPEAHPSEYPKALLATLSFLDERLDRLAEMSHSKKKTFLRLELIDSPQLTATPDKGLNFAQVREAEGFAVVLSAYADSSNPPEEFKKISSELLLKDLEVLESSIRKLEEELKKGRKEREKEHPVLLKCQEALKKEMPLRTLELSADEEKWIRPYEFLSGKPLMLLVNIAEKTIGQKLQYLGELEALGFPCIPFCAKTEKELLELDQEERKSFMADLGIEHLAKDAFLRASFQAFRMISFFTMVGDEARAWPLEKGKSVLEAAGKIHTDMARGFIKAEVFSSNDLFTHGSIQALREKGLLRLEGKEYAVQDGDVLTIKFSV